jgi:GT2 family glycosyltransferase
LPHITILLLTYNSAAHLPRCLDCLKGQTIQNFEIILIDNASQDNSLAIARQCQGGLNFHIIEQSQNLGFASANNIGARLAQGRWLVLLNADAYPEPGWLENLVKVAQENPGFNFFSSRQLQYHAPHFLDGAGDAYHISGLAWRNAYQLLSTTHALEKKEVFSACAAAALYSREDFLEVGGFDEDYFSYFEDVDIGFRLRLGGGKCLYVPEAVVHHVGSGSTGKRSDFSVYYGYRNLVWTFVKNMPSPLIWVLLPLHIATLLFFVAYLTLRGQGRVMWKAMFDAVRGLPKVFRKRKVIQQNKKIKTGDLWKVMSTGLLEPYREFMQRNGVK